MELVWQGYDYWEKEWITVNSKIDGLVRQAYRRKQLVTNCDRLKSNPVNEMPSKEQLNPYNPITEPASFKWFNEKPLKETPVTESKPVDNWDWYGWLCARIPELNKHENKFWLHQCVNGLIKNEQEKVNSNKLWEMAKYIAEHQKLAHELPKEKIPDWSSLTDDWFDWLEDQLKG